MILDASQRGHCMEMGRHLLNARQNEQVEVREVRGFLADDVLGAMKEIEAVARGTRATQPLFSVSLSPPPTENVRIEVFEGAIAMIEERNGLTGQPRVVVFHEKEGRRHCHAVWSRIDAETMTAVPLPHFKLKLREVSRELFMEHGWRMPRGLVNSKELDPRNFSLDEWQQAKRIGRDPKALKTIVQECYAASDSGPAFAKALEERGLYLAKGDRRAHVAVTYEGEVISIARHLGRKTKEVTARLGSVEQLRSVEETRQHIASVITPKIHELRSQADRTKETELAGLDRDRLAMAERHRIERVRMDEGQKARREAENRERAGRMRGGLAGLLDKLTGEAAKTRKRNEMEAFFALERDRTQRQRMIEAQMDERRTLQQSIDAVRQRHINRIEELHRDLSRQMSVPMREAERAPASWEPPQDRLAERFARISRQRSERGISRDRGPGFDLER